MYKQNVRGLQIMEDIIFGKNAVLEALEAKNREFNKVIIANNIHTDGKISKIKELCQKNGIIFQFVAKEKFAQYSEFNHQGVIAQVSPIKYMYWKSFWQKNIKILQS